MGLLFASSPIDLAFSVDMMSVFELEIRFQEGVWPNCNPLTANIRCQPQGVRLGEVVLQKQGLFRSSAAFILDAAALEEAGESPAIPEMDPALLEELTTREREVFDRLVTGESVRDIGKACAISEHTVRNHIKSIYRKLGLHSRLDIVRAVLGR